MEQTKPGAAGIAFKWAIINVVAGILLTVIYQVAHVDQNGPIKWLSLIPLILFIYLSQNEWKNRNGGFMTYGEGFVEGLLFGVFAGILGAIFSYIYLTYINPKVLEDALAATHQALIDKGMTDTQLEKADEMAKTFTTPVFAAIGALIGTPIIAMIIALITSAILKKERTFRDIENQHSDPAV